MLLALIAVGLAMPMVLAGPPLVADHSWVIQEISVQDMRFLMASFEISMDQPLYLHGLPIDAVNYTRKNPYSEMPTFGSFLEGMSTMTCDALEWTSVPENNDNDDPPSELMTGYKTFDSVASFLLAIGGAHMPTDIKDKKGLSFNKLLAIKEGGDWMYFDEGFSLDALRQCNRTLYLRNGLLTNAAGESLANDTVVVFDEPPHKIECNWDGFESLVKAVSYVQDFSKRVEGIDQVEQFSFLFASLESRRILQACKRVLEPLFTMADKEITRPGSRDCFAVEGTPQFMENPCCNDTLRFKQCCAPTTVTGTRKILQNVSETVVDSVCEHPGRTKLAIRDYIKTTQGREAIMPDIRGLFENYYKFAQECNTIIYSTRCNDDTACFQDQVCDNNRGYCEVPWGNETGLMMNCYSQKMDLSMKNALKKKWLIPSDEEERFVARLSEELTTYDCVGETSEEWRSKWVHGEGEDDDEVFVPGNRTGCLAEKKCNWNDRLNEEECLREDGLSGDSFCGECHGGDYCHTRSRPSYCQINTYSGQSGCEAVGLYWHREEWESPDDDSAGRCVNTSLNSQELCAPSNKCPDMYEDGIFRPWRCNQWAAQGCYTHALNKSECLAEDNSREFNSNEFRLTWHDYLNGGDGTCAVRNYNPETSFTQAFCDGFNRTTSGGKAYFLELFLGHEWWEGELDTEEKCHRGMCNWENPSREWINPSSFTREQCESKQMCSKRCPRCQQNGGRGNSVCYRSVEMDSVDCASIGGELENVLNEGEKLCVLGSNLNETECLGLGHSNLTYADCGTLTDRDTCAAGLSNLQNYMRCEWQEWAPCRNQEECEGSGECDDWDFFTWFSNGDREQGACLVESQLNDDGWPKSCNEQSALVEGGYQTLDWSNVPGRCIDRNARETTCNTTARGHWYEKSYSEDSCAGKPKRCETLFDHWSGMNADECHRCDGEMVDVYRWTSGRWENAKLIPYEWKSKAWVSRNQWAPTTDWNSLRKLVETAVAVDLQAAYFKVITKKYGGLVPIMSKLICDCTGGSNERSCFGNVTSTPLDIVTVLLGESFASDTEACSIQGSIGDGLASGRRLLADEAVVSIEINSVTANDLATDDGSYAVVYHNGVVVGQLVGDCTELDGLNVNGGNANVSLNLRYDIAIDNETYTVPYVAEYESPMVTVYTEASDATLDGSAIKTSSITTSGTYCPVYLTETWAEAELPTTTMAPETTTTMSPTSSPTTMSPTSSPTTMSPTSSPTTMSPTSSPTTMSPTTMAPTPPATAAGSDGSSNAGSLVLLPSVLLLASMAMVGMAATLA